MRIILEKIEIRYEESCINLRLYVPGEKYARWLYIDWRKWDFICGSMDYDRSWNILKIGDFAVTDGVNRLLEFFSDAIRIYDFGSGGGHGEIHTFSFPFEVLRQKVRQRVELIDEAEMNKIRLRYWPRSKVVWSDRIDRRIFEWRTVREKVLPHIASLRRIAKNSSDGQLCVIHIGPDSLEGQTPERLEADEMPSFYWEIFRYKQLADMPESLRDSNLRTYRSLVHMGKTWIVDNSVAGGSKEYPVYGRIMNGGLIWHGQKSGYLIHT